MKTHGMVDLKDMIVALNGAGFRVTRLKSTIDDRCRCQMHLSHDGKFWCWEVIVMVSAKDGYRPSVREILASGYHQHRDAAVDAALRAYDGASHPCPIDQRDDM